MKQKRAAVHIERTGFHQIWIIEIHHPLNFLHLTALMELTCGMKKEWNLSETSTHVGAMIPQK